jgi:hypothetical protein
MCTIAAEDSDTKITLHRRPEEHHIKVFLKHNLGEIFLKQATGYHHLYSEYMIYHFMFVSLSHYLFKKRVGLINNIFMHGHFSTWKGFLGFRGSKLVSRGKNQLPQSPYL